MKPFTLVYPTSSNPPTIGHADILRRAAEKFDCVYWVAAVNPFKSYLFPLAERMAMMLEYIEHYQLKNVVLDHHEGVMMRYAKSKGAAFLLRGLRNATDFQFEFDMASGNRGIEEKIETLCIFADPVLSCLSSAMVRELAVLGENFGRYVIPSVEKRIQDFFAANPSLLTKKLT